MKTVNSLLAATICMGLSGVVYAEPSPATPSKPVASATDTAKPKVMKHKVQAPSEAAPNMKAKSTEHAVNTTPEAASKVKSAAKVSKPTTPVVKTEPAVAAPKAVK